MKDQIEGRDRRAAALAAYEAYRARAAKKVSRAADKLTDEKVSKLVRAAKKTHR